MEIVGIGEEITLKKGNEMQGRVVVGEVSDRKLGGAETKNKVVAVSENRRNMNLVVREALVLRGDQNCFGNESVSMTSAQRYYERWLFLSKIGIPTIGSMRVVDEKKIAMGDMTADGSEFFGKAKDIGYIDEQRQLRVRDLLNRPVTEIERIFLGIDIEEIKKEICRIQERAWDNGVRLPGDDPFDILVHPDGSWQVLVTDLTELHRRGNEPDLALKYEQSKMWEGLDILKQRLIEITNFRGN